MTQPAKPTKNEKARLKRLERLMVLDSQPEALFDEITKLASQICGTPIALVSLVDKNRQWFKASVGLEGTTETHRDFAFCAHTILDNHILEIPDATKDKRFKNNPLVTSDPNIRFYAGIPLLLPDGNNVGTLCVIDRKPKHLNKEQKAMLSGLASIVAKALLFREDSLIEKITKESKLASIIETSRDAIISKSLDGTVTSWNHAAEEMFGYSSDEMLGQRITKLFPREKLHEEDDFIKRITQNQTIKHFETERIAKNKKFVQISVSLSPVKNSLGEIIGISTIARDITQVKQLQKSLAHEHERLRVTMDSIADAVITTNTDGKVTYINPVAENLTGWSAEDALNKNIEDVFTIVNDNSRLPCMSPIDRCLSENKITSLENNTLLISRNGNEYGIEDSAAPIRDKKGETIGVVLVFHDVSAQRIMANEITYRATHDQLTGLLNRSEFELLLKSVTENYKNPDEANALMFIDLDQFKVVNDSCGHAAGDKLLKEISNVIQNCIRTTDIFARIGGDEFAIILPQCNTEKSLEIANSICQSVHDFRLTFDKQKFRIGASIGLVMIDSHWTSITNLLKAADNACYMAKGAGRNRVHLHYKEDGVVAAHIKEAQWANRIPTAIEENQFELYCQRIIPLSHSGLEHAEVLLRLRDESGELVSPALFIPAAERFHMMPRIDRWVFKNLLDWVQKNISQLNHTESFSINLSGQSISDKTFHQYVKKLIDSVNFNHSKLCFEITETAAITNVSDALTFINSMKQYGIKFSLDDFGSGVSSFGYLKNLPVDYLKIDGQFIKDIVENDIGQATVKCICEVAQITNIKTIAEWVDNKAAEDMLKGMGVHYTQGFLKHKPAPINEMLEPTHLNQTIEI